MLCSSSFASWSFSWLDGIACMIWVAYLQFDTILKPTVLLVTFRGFSLAAQAWFYQHSCKFIWFLFFLTLRGFSLAVQNPSKMHDFTSMPSTSCDFEADGCFCLLFEVAAWSPRTSPESTILAPFLHSIFLGLKANRSLLLTLRDFDFAAQNLSKDIKTYKIWPPAFL